MSDIYLLQNFDGNIVYSGLVYDRDASNPVVGVTNANASGITAFNVLPFTFSTADAQGRKEYTDLMHAVAYYSSPYAKDIAIPTDDTDWHEVHASCPADGTIRFSCEPTMNDMYVRVNGGGGFGPETIYTKHPQNWGTPLNVAEGDFIECRTSTATHAAFTVVTGLLPFIYPPA